MQKIETSAHTPPYAFEKAREAVMTLKTLRRTLSPAELETLALLLDNESMEIIGKSSEETKAGKFEKLEDAIEE